MGCDIHLYREKLINGSWVTADKWTAYDYGDDDKGQTVEFNDSAYTGRNYQLFGLLSCGVRREHNFSFAPRGFPFNASKEVTAEIEKWGVDAHGQSYLYLFELKEIKAHLDTVMIKVSGMKDRNKLKELRDSIESGNPNWDLLFPYCKWSSCDSDEEFEIEVPASFYMGGGLEEIIASFEDIKGDNHRIVFFFDN